MYFRLKQVQLKDKSQSEVFLNSSSNKTIETQSSVKPPSIYNRLVPYIDSDKDGSDAESSSLSGEDNGTPVIVGKVKHSTDQIVSDKKPLVMRPKEDSGDEETKEITPKKCLVLKPRNDDSPVTKRENLLPKKCLVLKPKDDEPLEVKTEQEFAKKCLVRIPKDDCDSNTSKVFLSVEGKDSEKKHRRRENGTSEFDSNKLKIRLEYNNYNGLVFITPFQLY